MSKQMDAKGMLTNEQYELARTLYMQWLRKANNIVQLPMCESSHRTTILILSQTRLNCGSDSHLTASLSLLTTGPSSTSLP